MDASSLDKKIVNGFHACETIVLTKNEKQPISIYSKIYSCKSKNAYTLESIKVAENLIGKNFIGVFERGYDDNNHYSVV